MHLESGAQRRSSATSGALKTRVSSLNIAAFAVASLVMTWGCDGNGDSMSALSAQAAAAAAAFSCPAACDDNDPCTRTRCDAAGACLPSQAKSLGARCDDGLPCSVMDFCDANGKCGGTLAPACIDGDPCTTDACDVATGKCAHAASANPQGCAKEPNCEAEKACKGPDCFGPLHAPKAPCRSWTSDAAKSVDGAVVSGSRGP